jgi:3-hydroxyisobutyrate dehydrogenase
MPRMRVTVLGTGIMGAAMVRNLVRSGHEVTVWNRTRGRAEALELDGARVSFGAPDAVAGAEAVVTMLADGAAVEDVMTGEGALGAFPEGCVWIQMSTIGVEATERLAELAAEAGVVFVDAPVSGSRAPAEAGTLIVLASGPDDAIDRVQPVFDAVGSTTRRLGAAGNGSRFKLVLNAWLVLLNSGIAEVLTLARALGFKAEQVVEALDGAPLDAPFARMKAQLMIAGDFEPAFPLKHALKDARLALAAAGPDLGLVEAAAEQMEHADALGHGDSDMAATICALAEIPARAD